MHRQVAIAGFVVALVAVGNGSLWAQVQQRQQMPGALPFEDSGTLESAEGQLLKVRDSNDDIWMMQLGPDAMVLVQGEATRDYPKPGMLVQLFGEFDKKGELVEELSEIQIISSESQTPLGFYDPDDESEEPRPVRSPEAGEYWVLGKLVTFAKDKLTVAVGSRKIGAKLTDELAIYVLLDDPSLARKGDSLDIKAWYYEYAKPVSAANRPGQAVIEGLTITLAEPLKGSSKDNRRSPIQD